MSRLKFLKFWSIAVGSMDALTGLLLVVCPVAVLRLLGIAAPSSDALSYLSWMGVFVGTVGLSYTMALGERARGETVWMFTAMVRILVALFLTVKIISGSMPAAWAMVGVSDGFVGIVQIMILRAGWWKGVAK